VVEPAGDDLGVGVAQQLGDRVDHRHQHRGRILLDPARARMGERLVAPRLGHGLQVEVVQNGLDRRGPFVDSEQSLSHGLTAGRRRAYSRATVRSDQHTFWLA
jgi:hypothetical protein